MESGPGGSAGFGGTTHKATEAGVTDGSGGNVDGDAMVLDVVTSDVEPEIGTILYAHNRDTLFEMDPKATRLSVEEVGKFDCIGVQGESSMTDIAVDQDGKLFGVSTKALFLDMQLSGNTVQCMLGKVMIDEGTRRFSVFRSNFLRLPPRSLATRRR